MGANIELIRSY